MKFEEHVLKYEFQLNDTDDQIIDDIRTNKYYIHDLSIQTIAKKLGCTGFYKYFKLKKRRYIILKMKNFVSYNINNKLEIKIYNAYLKYHKEQTYSHVVNVARISIILATRYQLNINKCVIASLLHDISVIMSPDEMYQLAIKNHFVIDPAEEKYHFLLHQRISKIISLEEFDILDEDILSAIECHTTLKKKANTYDKVIFLADKIAWDQQAKPPYYDILLDALNTSLDYACYTFIKYQFDNGRFLMPHKWIIESYKELKEE